MQHSPLPLLPLTDGTVLLRFPRDTDAAAVVEHSRHPDLQDTYWLPVASSCSLADAHSLIREFKASFSGRFGLTLVISTPANEDAFAGIITLGLHNSEMGEVCYGVAPDYRNQGLATRAVKLITGWACSYPALKRLELRVGLSNLASQRVAEKAGFVREGIVRMRVPATGKEYDDFVYAHSCSQGKATAPTADVEKVADT